MECKARSIRKNFRDVDGAIKRITSDFGNYIQEGSDQAKQLKDFILGQDVTKLYDKRGNEILRIKKDTLSAIECICVTKENEGALATDLTHLLEKDDGDEFPYCIGLHGLGQIAEYGKELGINPDVFSDFIAQRKKIQGKGFSDDELDFWGFFLEHGSFEEIIKASSAMVHIAPSYSSRFDEAYRRRQ